jgi:hypothetical protein
VTVKNDKVDLRFAVGESNGPHSAIWRGYSNKEGVYVSHGGMGGIQKFSFHKSLICRHAFTKQEGPADGEDDRVIHKWRREIAPQTGGIVYALVARFPSDFLSTALEKERKTVTWLPAAISGHATVVEFVFSALGRDATYALAQSSGRTIVSYTAIPNGEAFVVSWVHEKWNGEPFTFPGIFDRDDQCVISKYDPTNSGRPNRFTLFLDPTDNQPMIVDEFGAYFAPLDTQFVEPMGSFTDRNVKKRSKPT